MAPTSGSYKRRWSSRIGTIIRRTSKSHRPGHSISFDQDVEFVPRNCDDSGRTLPPVALDAQPTLSKLCSIAESPLREAEAMQSVPSFCSDGPFYEADTPSSESLTSQVVTDSPASAKPFPPRIGGIFIVSPTPSTDQEPVYKDPQAMDPPQLNFTENLTLITETQEAQVPRSESTDEVSTASFYEMMHCNSIHHAPSKSSLSTTSRDHLPLDFGHIGLLTPRDTLETPVTAHSFDDRDNLVSWFPYSPSSDKLEKLHTIGWLEYHFPNGNFYYFHPERKLSTEADLTNDTVFNLVEEFWEQEGVDVGIWSGLRRNSKLGMTSNGFVEDEIWLKDIGSSNEGSNLMFEMWWVDHVARTMVLASSSQEINNDGAAIQEDHIDMEHRYWAFMQSHPAHTVLPPNAKSAAINTLAWAWTDHLLSSHPSDSIPFTRDECRDSLTLLQSLIVEKQHHQVIQTCIVASVFLQVAKWHKSHRYDKVSPTNVSISISISESSSIQLHDSPKLEKSWAVRHIFLNLVIFVSILLFTLLYALGNLKNGFMFTQIQLFVDKMVGSLGQASASLPTSNWTGVLQRMGLRDTPDTAI